jgi:phospholipid-binding lipoprotein MlaA
MTIPLRRVFAIFFAAWAILLGGCATTASNPQDPLEPFNRGVYHFNDTVDHLLLKPAAQIYTGVVPQIARTGVHNFFSNISDILNALNSFLQARPEQGFDSVARVTVNTTFGLLGMIDVASAFKIPKHNNDFGLTLARWGVDSGPYLVLPFFGPSDFRDAVGLGVDAYADAQYYIFRDVPTRNTLYGLRIIDNRAQLLKASNILEQAALDPYTFTRDAYQQRRRAQVSNVRSQNGDDAAEPQQQNGAQPSRPPSSSAADSSVTGTAQPSADPVAAPQTGSSAMPSSGHEAQSSVAPASPVVATVTPLAQATPAVFRVWLPSR